MHPLHSIWKNYESAVTRHEPVKQPHHEGDNLAGFAFPLAFPSEMPFDERFGPKSLSSDYHSVSGCRSFSSMDWGSEAEKKLEPDTKSDAPARIRSPAVSGLTPPSNPIRIGFPPTNFFA